MKRQLFFTVLAALGAFALVVLAGVPLPYATQAQAQASPSVAVSLSSDTVEEGSAITVTMSFSGLESDADTATRDYVFRADVKGSEDGDADGCEDQAGGYGLGVDRYMWKVDEDLEVRTGSVSADCPAGDYTVRASISDANGSELAADSADFSVVEPPSTDAALSGLALSGVDMGTFDPATYSYDVNVGHDLAETTVTPTPNDEGATYVVRRDGVEDGDGTVPLAEGSNVISVEVTAEDGQTTKTYIVIVTKAAPPLSNDATLSGLTLSGVNFGAFDMAATNYAAEVGHDVTESTVTPTASDDGATYVVKLGGVVDADRTVSLAVGENVLTIEVTAEDGQSTKTYTVTVTRADAEQAPSNPPEAPDKPTGEVTGKGQVALDWNDVAGATYYQARFWSSTEWVELPTADFGIVFDGSRATVSGLPNYGYYYFSVRAGNAGGPSDWSDFLTLYNPG